MDSAKIYINQILSSTDSGEVWSRSMAALAYIEQMQGNLSQADTILYEILEKVKTPQWQDYVRKKLRLPVEITFEDNELLIAKAESLWVAGDAEAAQRIYLLVAANTDTTQILGAKALLAAAYISRKELGQDTLANKLYSELASRYPNTPQAKYASKRLGPGGIKKAERPTPIEPIKESKEVQSEQSKFTKIDTLTKTEEIFTVDSVDEPPTLITSDETLKTYLRNYYPFEAFSENIQGEVEVEFVVNHQGKIRNINVLYAIPENLGFETAAIEVVKLLQYNPGYKNGRSVSVRIKERLIFPSPTSKE